MYQAVFISDLHLHPEDVALNAKWRKFLAWVIGRTESLYILGDFVHAWAGDDVSGTWGQELSAQIRSLQLSGIKCYFMHGNRDFLIGQAFAEAAGLSFLEDPSIVKFQLTDRLASINNQILNRSGSNQLAIMLTHGDGYCTNDRRHQWFRWITRSSVFISLFLKLPKKIRASWVQRIRMLSEQKHLDVSYKLIDVDSHLISKHLDQGNSSICIHGHTHQGKMFNINTYQLRYVLSDWDAEVKILTLTHCGELKYFCLPI